MVTVIVDHCPLAVSPVVHSGGARILFLLGHKWDTITPRYKWPTLLSEWARRSGSQQWGACARAWVRDGVAPLAKMVRGCQPRKFFENVLSKSCLLVPWAPKSWPLLVWNMVLWNAKNWCCITVWNACLRSRGTAGAQGFTAGAQAPSSHRLAPPLVVQ